MSPDLIDLRPIKGKDVFISDGAVVIGNVTIGDNVLIAPNATIRCDEPDSEIIIGSRCNIQDNVVIHSLKGCKVVIGAGTSIGHGAIVHGPCEIGERCFVGFGSVVFRSVLGNDAMVMHRALLEETEIPAGMKVPSGTVIIGPAEGRLERVDEDLRRFSENVRHINITLAKQYGESRNKVKNTSGF